MLNKGYKIGATVMDLPKVFGMLNQKILFKIKACGFDTNVLTLIQSYFLNRHQIMIKISDKFANGKKSQQVCHKFLFLVFYFSTLY